MEEYLKRLRVLAGINESAIKEAPITDFGTVGDFDKPDVSMHHQSDRRSVTDDRMVQKIKQQWEKTPFNFNLYFVNKPGYEKFLLNGQIDKKFFQHDFPELVDRISDNAINVIFTNNIGAGRIRLTPWIIAHRFSHSLFGTLDGYHPRYEIFEIEEMYHKFKFIIWQASSVYDDDSKSLRQNPLYGLDKRLLYYQIGTMNSARKKRLTNQMEFLHEITAQYLITGKIRFNQLTQEYFDSVFPKYDIDVSHPEVQEYNQYLENLSKELPDRYEKLLSRIVGKIFVM